jgi:hypothetical protein
VALDFTAALGQLLVDSRLRQEFSRDPTAAVRRLGVRAADRDALAALDPAGIEAQAATLLDKRLHQARQLLPRTFARLNLAGEASFLEYAVTRWPTGTSRHLDDAVGFCRHLLARGAAAVCHAELNYLRFVRGHRRFGLHLVHDPPVAARPRWALQALYRWRHETPPCILLFLRL